VNRLDKGKWPNALGAQASECRRSIVLVIIAGI